MSSELRNYDAWKEGAFMRNPPAGSPYAREPDGKEDLLGQRVWLEEEDAWGTVEEAEHWTDAEFDEDGEEFRYGGTDYSIRLEGESIRTVTMSEPALEELLKKQKFDTIRELNLEGRAPSAEEVKEHQRDSART